MIISSIMGCFGRLGDKTGRVWLRESTREEERRGENGREDRGRIGKLRIKEKSDWFSSLLA